jgi:ERCC4-related helicase
MVTNTGPALCLPTFLPQAQRETMALFRGGTDVNLLLATYVGAEGLDFGDCGAVVLLEPAAHLVDYVQVKQGGSENDLRAAKD